VLRTRPEHPPPRDFKAIEQRIAARNEPVNILDVLTDTDAWLQWTRVFGLQSRRDPHLDDARAHYIATTFCYGCHLGPTQTAQSVGTFDRRQLARIDLRHNAEDTLDAAITTLINAYNRFALLKFWGSGKSPSADGMKWELYEQDLLAEGHIRYGGC
jgi:Tn3 transposase DDE domain